ncbi:MAG: dipeptide ABC transporter ATP-binding protein [Proteobacteria bacterium]|nr:dipeptide ABC transporter ATP-binding protein [Pseudomonadota bacterium]
MSEALVVAQDLVRRYPVPRRWPRPPQWLQALGGVSFTLAAGRTLAVVGESGCGKSTLARQVTMVETPDEGTLAIEGIDVVHADAATRRRLRSRVQMVFQNPHASLNPRKTVESLLAEPLVIRGDTAAERRRHVLASVERVGLPAAYLRRYPHMLSGGQRQRVAIARALMLEPALVVADEPVSALDLSVQAQVLNLLADLQRELGVAYLFISHNLAVVRHVAHDVLVMYLGRVVESGPRERVFVAPAHPYTRALLASAPTLAGATPPALHGELPSPLAPPSGCAFRERCPYSIAACAADVPPLLPRPDGGPGAVACIRASEILGAAI